jgi:hypothetical protein
MSAQVKVGATGGNAEAVDRLEIRRSHSARQVALSLGPAEGKPPLPDLRAGDEILVSAELELTTDCERQQSDCIGDPYAFQPEIESRILLAASATAVAPAAGQAVAITKLRREPLSHAHHHHVLVYDNAPYTIRATDISWSGPTYVNLVVSARNAQAGARNVVLVGQNDAGGVIGGDMAGLSVIRVRGGPAPATRVLNDHLRTQSIPVVKGETRVLYSCPVPTLHKGNQLAIKGLVKTSTAHLSYPARTSLRVLLADRPIDSKPGSYAKQLVVTPEVSRLNGTNRLSTERAGGTSTKVGVLRATKDATKPVFVNVVLETGDPLQKAKQGDVMKILDQGSVRVSVYAPELDG